MPQPVSATTRRTHLARFLLLLLDAAAPVARRDGGGRGGDGRGADEDGHARGGGIPQPPQDEEEEAQQPQRGEEGGEAHGDLPSSEDGTEGATQLEEEGRLAVEALEDAVVDEARNEEVARFRHVRADGRVASLGRVEDGRDDHHGKPDDGQRDEQQNLSGRVSCRIVYVPNLSPTLCQHDQLAMFRPLPFPHRSMRWPGTRSTRAGPLKR